MDDARDCPSAVLRGLIDGYRVSQAISVAATLRIADALADGPRSSDQLAADCGAHAGALYRLLRALASVGVFEERPQRQFALTPVGEGLRSTGAATPAGGKAVYAGAPDQWQAWGALLHSVRTGQNAYRHVHGMSVWEYRARHPQAAEIFNRAMAELSQSGHEALLDAYDFGRHGVVVDVGGGTGGLLAAVLRRHPDVRGVLFDRPALADAARATLRQAGVAERCEVVGGSFFDAVPPGGDAYVLKSILHDWDDPAATTILAACRRQLADHAMVLIVERDLGPANADPEPKFIDLTMLVSPGGQERTEAEYVALLDAAGLRLTGVTQTADGTSVFQARA